MFALLTTLALLTTALLFGGMVLFSFGFAAFLFSALPADVARKAIRQAFPYFYLFVIATAVLAAGLIWSRDALSEADRKRSWVISVGCDSVVFARQ